MSLRTGKVIIFIAMCGLLLAAAYVSVLVVQRQNALKEVSRYNIAWVAGRAINEFLRLQEHLVTVAGGGDVDSDEMQLRLDIVSNRLQILERGDFKEFAGHDPADLGAIEALRIALHQLDPLSAKLDQPDIARQALTILAPLDSKLEQLAASAYQYSGDRVADDQRELIRLHWIFSSIAAGLFVLGLSLLGLLGWHNKMLGRAHKRLHRLADDLGRTSSDLELANHDISKINGELQARNEILSRRDKELGTQNRRFDAALNNMSHALCMVDATERLVVFNQRFAELFSIDITPLPGMPFRDLVDSSSNEALNEIFTRQQGILRDGSALEFVYDHADRAISISHQPMRDGGWVATYEDISTRRRAEAQIAFMAHHDGLTSLANRSFFHSRLESSLRKLDSHHRKLAIFSLDLDRFKVINDTLGHPVGDALLRKVALRLKANVRESDLVARVGGDEFTILQIDGETPDAPEAVAQRIIDAVSEPYSIDGVEVNVRASVGIAMAPDHGTILSDLMKNADLALYRAKAEGRKTFRVFEADMDNDWKARRELEADLRTALDRNEFQVYYQPLVSLQTDDIGGFEALARWVHPKRGMVSPADFIPIAEETGLIDALGEWVLHQACLEAATWPADLMLAVNLSPIQFRSGHLLETVRTVLHRTGFQASRLELEITESVLLNDSDETLVTLHELRAMGIAIALDDFGTGYSSLSYLRSFPFDKIKIDQSFVRELSSRPDCIKIVQSIAALGSSLGMTTTAEGVETPQQVEQLKQAGCDQLQGYFFGRPQPAEKLRFRLDKRAAEAA